MMSHGQIRTSIAIKSLNSLALRLGIDVVAAPSPATSKINTLAFQFLIRNFPHHVFGSESEWPRFGVRRTQISGRSSIVSEVGAAFLIISRS
jgi:hypothetical protein